MNMDIEILKGITSLLIESFKPETEVELVQVYGAAHATCMDAEVNNTEPYYEFLEKVFGDKKTIQARVIVNNLVTKVMNIEGGKKC